MFKVKKSKVKVTAWQRAEIPKIINNSAGYCSISLKLLTDFDHVTLDVPRTFKINGWNVKVTVWHNISASKNAIIQVRISCRRLNLVKIIREPTATRYMAFKVIRSNIEITITRPRIDRLRSDLVQCFITSQAIYSKGLRSKVKLAGSKVEVTA